MDTKAIKQTENDLTEVKNFLENCRKLYRTEPIEIDEKEFLHIEGLGLCENCYELPNGRIFQGSPELQLGLKGYFIKVADNNTSDSFNSLKVIVFWQLPLKTYR